MSLGEILLPCPGCGVTLGVEPATEPSQMSCVHCGESIALSGGEGSQASAPQRCLVCGSPDLYWRKDFPQKLGCSIVLAGALLVPWTWGLSLAVVALIDLALYQALPKVAVCYVCHARYRGLPPHPEQGPFDLATAQRREARSRNWTEGKLRPAFGPGEPPVSAAPAAPEPGGRSESGS